MPELVTTTTGLYEGKTLTELENGVLAKLGEPEQSFVRYTQAEVRAHLNTALRNFCRVTRILKGFAIAQIKQGIREYKLPTGFIDFPDQRYPARFRAADGTGYTRLERTSEQKLDHESGTWRDRTGTPAYLYKGGVYGNTRLFGLYPLPDADGDEYTGDSDAGIVITATNVTLGGNITGLHKAGFGNSAFFVDNEGRNFSALGVVVGMTIENLTDGSQGIITAIGNQDATNDKITVTLAGGTDNDFDESDSVIIYAGEYGVITTWESATEKYIFNTEYGVLAQVTVPNGNVSFSYIRQARKLSIATQYPEIPADFHEELEWYAAGILLGTEHDGRIDIVRAEAYLALWKEGLGRGASMVADNLGMREALEPDSGYIGEL